MAADKIGRKVSGAFNALMSAAVKYGLLTSKDGKLAIQPLFRSIKLAYSDAEKRKFLGEALLSPPLFGAIVDRFDGQMLPTEHFEKLLVREFNVPDDLASRTAQYFLQGAKQADLLSAAGVVSRHGESSESGRVDQKDNDGEGPLEQVGSDIASVAPSALEKPVDEYLISFKGPGLDSIISIREEEDLLIVEAILKKIGRSIGSKSIRN